MGTSPFMGAGQFGNRSRIYYETFWNKPENMVRLFMVAIELGFDGIQAVAYPRILDALYVARQKTGQHIPIIASVPPREIQESLWNLADMKAEVVLAHGAITDKAVMSNDFDALANFAKQVRNFAIPGAATHSPNETLPRLLKSDLELEYLMTPLNAIGKFVNDLEDLLKIINENGSNTKIIAMKPLAAGEIAPQEAFDFLFQQKGVDAIAVGITSIEEANEIAEIVNSLRETT